ncbi:hypothetical protein CEP54_007525 [Fusarium duplospermum]|uniref:Uncharacterized protein n=1 Tax=Fusarium duplospermum TaxID=1325734 RepID=A0A428Q176_9HYPO|nr:hypothetical protein CEP54_007525 [Fusarium duplospermum]
MDNIVLNEASLTDAGLIFERSRGSCIISFSTLAASMAAWSGPELAAPALSRNPSFLPSIALYADNSQSSS